MQEKPATLEEITWVANRVIYQTRAAVLMGVGIAALIAALAVAFATAPKGGSTAAFYVLFGASVTCFILSVFVAPGILTAAMARKAVKKERTKASS